MSTCCHPANMLALPVKTGAQFVHTCQPEMAKMTDFASLPRGLDNLAMGPKQHHLYSKPEYVNSQHASFYCNIHRNMFHFTAISTTTCFTLLQDTPQPGSFYCNITTCFILLQYQSQHASFYCNMLHFTAISTTTCFILLQYPPQHASFYCNIHHNMLHFTARYTTTWFILLQYHNMLHFTATCFILLVTIREVTEHVFD